MAKQMTMIEVEENLNMCENYIKKINHGHLKGQQKTKAINRMNSIFPRLKKEMLDLMKVGLFDITIVEIKKIETSLRNITSDEKNKGKPVEKKMNQVAYANTNIKHAVNIANKITKLDTKIVYIIKILNRNSDSLCIGSAHTMYEEIRKTLLERRRLKNQQIENENPRAYTCRTERFEQFLNKNKITKLGDVKINRRKANELKGVNGNVPYLELYEMDIKHFIELSPTPNLRIAYLTIKELVETNNKKVRGLDLIELESKLFRR